MLSVLPNVTLRAHQHRPTAWARQRSQACAGRVNLSARAPLPTLVLARRRLRTWDAMPVQWQDRGYIGQKGENGTAACGPASIRGGALSIPNLITLGRILLVPVVIWAITAGEMSVALALFLLAGISDAVDGFLAKRFGMRTELGGYLDPLADKRSG